MKVSVIGTGYVGLTTGVTLAYLGHDVTCVDINEKKVSQLSSGILPIYEPGMDGLLKEAQAHIRFTTSYSEAAAEADVIFMAVGTPAYADGSPNLTYLYACAEQLLEQLAAKTSPTILVNKSTAPVGTTDQIEDMVLKAGLAATVTVASNPEFLRQGQAIRDTLYPERIVVGGNETARSMLRELYSGIIEQSFQEPVNLPRPQELPTVSYIGVDRRSAELAKYAANAFLAMKISFINEIANVCDLVGADVSQVADIIGQDQRIGRAFLKAGIGYGGSCFPKDTGALQYIANTNGYDFKLLSAVIEVNNSQKFKVIDKVTAELGDLTGKKIAVLGLTFKPETDDMRDAPSIPIIKALLELGASVHVHDPVAGKEAEALLPSSVHIAAELDEALQNAEAALLVTEWPHYVHMDAGHLRSIMKRPLLIDGRNALDKSQRAGLDYRGIGIAGHLFQPAPV